MSKRTTKEIFEAFHDGDTLSDKDLDQGIDACQSIVDALSGAGPIYVASLVYAINDLHTMRSQRSARQRD